MSTITQAHVRATTLATAARVNRVVESTMALCVLLAPLVYLTLRKSINGILILLAILALISLRVRGVQRVVAWERSHWVLLACFLAPLLTEGIAQGFRGDLSGSSFDGPVRFVFAGIVFTCLASGAPRLWTAGMQWTVPLSVLICLMTYLLNPATSAGWENRAATYFVDPITFGINVAILSLMSVVLLRQVPGSWGIRLLVGVTLVAGTYVVVMTRARSAWTCFSLTAVMLCVLWFSEQRRRLAMVLAALVLGAGALGLLHAPTHDRIALLLQEVQAYVQGTDRDTSTGIRLSLMRLDLHLFASHPLGGVEDGKLPPYDELIQAGPYVSPALYDMKVKAGSHNEFLAQVSRKGIWGICSFLALVIVPGVFFLRHARHPVEPVRMAAWLGTTLTMGYFVAGLSVQTFNLKYTASFYSLMVAVWAAQILQLRGDDEQG